MGLLYYFFGIEAANLDGGVLDLLERCHMENAKEVPTPMASSCQLSKHMEVGYADANWGLDFDDHQSTIRLLTYLPSHCHQHLFLGCETTSESQNMDDG
ncbi:hypothetical protein PVK06_011691 [Gossypium arboreum]|uniref:Uncharacterized protein n=1 Tax=Gossypium arboreum TaxID=29729 RepID=A0ABR0Q9T8_GOSAR|nr:hypothetical protein PVK06_011691 [Gossypium arboreum]